MYLYLTKNIRCYYTECNKRNIFFVMREVAQSSVPIKMTNDGIVCPF